MGVLEEFLKYCLSQAKRANPLVFMHQAFGAVQYYLFVWADEEAEGINALSGQKRMFEGIVQKVRTQYVGDLETIVKDIMPSITTSMPWHEFRQFLVSLLPMVRNLTIENGGTIPQA